MNPDKLKKLYEHEQKRVDAMTDKDLHSRYAKMKDEYKIDAFYKVLKKEKRCPNLQKRIKRDTHPASGNGYILYKLYNEKLAKEVYYKIDSNDSAEIVCYHNGDSDDKQLVDIAVARNDWDLKCKSGFVPVEVESHLQSNE